MTIDFRLPEIHTWMFDNALPLWSTAGQDLPGLGFHEQLSFDGTALDVGFKRMRVQARQIYVFCHAAELGWNGPALAAAKNGVDFILAHGWLAEGGWATRLGPRGEQIDFELNSYEQSFVLFALGWYYKLTREPAILDYIHRTLDTMQARLAHPAGLGFLTTAVYPHMEQDPNMHFLEAMLVLFEVTGDARFAGEARKILRLFADQIHQPGSAVLLEDFDLDWRSPADPAHRVVEPGHHFEWIWLLWKAKRIIGDDLMDIAGPLFAFADRHGADPQGVVYDDILESGKILNATHRLWPQTEALKGCIAMSEFTGEDHSARIARIVGIMLDRFLNTTTPGLWTDKLDSRLVPQSTTVPASTLYHLFLAFAELQRWTATA